MHFPRAIQQAIAKRDNPPRPPRPTAKRKARVGQPIEIDRSTVAPHKFKKRRHRIGDPA